MHRLSVRCAGLLLLACLPALAQGSGSTSSRDGGGPPAPPPEAFAACAGQSQGASVSFSLRDGRTVQGICALYGDRLAARPSGGRDAGASPPDGAAQQDSSAAGVRPLRSSL